MSSEILAVPEEYLSEVIQIIRVGLERSQNVRSEVRQSLEEWCGAEEAYLDSLEASDD